MLLSSPVQITSRLLPGVRCDDAFISIDYAKRAGNDGRTRYQWYVDIADQEFTGDDLQSGCGGGDLRSGLESVLSFLSACGESVNYASRTGRESENADLFPVALGEWCAEHSDELSMLALEIEESAECIAE